MSHNSSARASAASSLASSANSSTSVSAQPVVTSTLAPHQPQLHQSASRPQSALASSIHTSPSITSIINPSTNTPHPLPHSHISSSSVTSSGSSNALVKAFQSVSSKEDPETIFELQEHIGTGRYANFFPFFLVL